MDNLCLKIGIHGIVPQENGVACHVGCLDVRKQVRVVAVGCCPFSSAASKNLLCGFSFPYNARSFCYGGMKNRYDAIGVDDVVLAEEKNDEVECEERVEGGEESEGQYGNWVMKILHVRSLWKQENSDKGVKVEDHNGGMDDDDNDDEESGEGCCGVDEECESCYINDDHDDEKIEFDQELFSKLLKRVSLAEARLYAQLSYLGSLAYDISQIKPKNLLRYHRLRFVTSSFEKKERAIIETEKSLAEEEHPGRENMSTEAADLNESKLEQAEKKDEKTEGEKLSTSAAYEVVASAASYLYSCTKSIIPFRTSKSTQDEDLTECDGVNISHENVSSFMATTESVTAVVAAKEEEKQAVADDLNSILASPCEWFICDNDQNATRYFVIQGSESLASWKANLLFEPIRFEGFNVLVHRGIYEVAKGMYEQLLPEVHSHIKAHGSHAKFRFTGHSLGGSLSLLVNLMLLIRGVVPVSSILPVITFGSPAVMCGGDQLLYQLGLPSCHVQSISMHRDIVPRAFSCNYPNHVAKILKAVNGNFRNHPCLNNQALLYAPMGEFLILQPSEQFSPHHHLLPTGSGLYLLSPSVSDGNEADKHFHAALSVFLNSPHPLDILSDRSAYGSSGNIYRDHDMKSYLKCIRNVIRQELNHIRQARKEHRHNLWLPLVDRSASATVGMQ